MRSNLKILLFCILNLVGYSAVAATVCLKNADGVEESWQTSDANAALEKSSAPCVPSIAIPKQSQDQSVRQWITSPSDSNMRLLIKRWSSSVGWSLVWSVDKDIPVDSGDSVNGDFKLAVRRLLSSTSLSDMQLKPCFYSNNVVRVVRETTKCNPNE